MKRVLTIVAAVLLLCGCTPQPPVVAFLGDSYIVGARAIEGERWADLVSAHYGWEQHNFGWSDTGYADPGQWMGGDIYASRIPELIKSDPDIVIVAGGRNDIGQDEEKIRAAVRQTFSELRDGLPDTPIYVLSPWWGDSEYPAELARIGQIIEGESAAFDVIYLEVGNPMLGQTAWMDEDGVHPIAPGYAAMAEAFYDAYDAYLDER